MQPAYVNATPGNYFWFEEMFRNAGEAWRLLREMFDRIVSPVRGFVERAIRAFRGDSDRRALAVRPATPEPIIKTRSDEAARPMLLSSALQEVWDALDGQALNAPALARKLGLNRSQDKTVAQRVRRIRKLGRKIVHHRGIGYYRPCAPPPWPDVNQMST